MRFSEHEMIFLNSITGAQDTPGKGGAFGEHAVFGIPLQFRTEGSRKEAVRQTIQSLIEKKVLVSETELSPEGFLPARTLEQYKNSERYVVINYIHAAIFGQRDADVIIPLGKREYEMFRIPRILLLYQLMKQYPIFLGSKRNVSGTEKEVLLEDFLSSFSQYEGNIIVGEYARQEIKREQVYFWKEGQIFVYDFQTRKQREISAWEMRQEFMEVLDIREEQMANGR